MYGYMKYVGGFYVHGCVDGKTSQLHGAEWSSRGSCSCRYATDWEWVLQMILAQEVFKVIWTRNNYLSHDIGT